MSDETINPGPTNAPAESPLQAEAAAPVDTMPSLEEALRTAELKASEHYDAWLRAKAETENVRRRAAEDAIKERKFAAEKVASAMRPVKDSLEAALGTENASLETLRSGVELTLKQLQQAFQSASLTEIAPQGEKFDPDGLYIKRYVPELAALGSKYIHAPWTAPPEVLRKAGITLGTTYPGPIVDHSEARQRALAAFQTLKELKAVCTS